MYLFMLWVNVCILSLDSEHHESSDFLFVLIVCVHGKVYFGGLYIGMHVLVAIPYSLIYYAIFHNIIIYPFDEHLDLVSDKVLSFKQQNPFRLV